MKDELIEGVEAWVVLPCTDRSGKHVSSWDICTNQPAPDASGVGVVASVYSGEATARAILAAVQAHAVISAEIEEVERDAEKWRALCRGELPFQSAALVPHPEGTDQ